MAIAFVAVLCVTSGACGIPSDASPRALPPEADANGAAAESATTVVTGQQRETAFVWYWESTAKKLVPVQRQVDLSDPTAVVTAALAAQTPREYSQGVASKIPEGTTIVDKPEIESGTLSVNLSADLNKLNAQAQREAVAQIVLTAGQISRVDAVRFSVDGKPIDVTSSEGQKSRVSECDFRESIAPKEVMEATGRSGAEVAYATEQSRNLEALCNE